MDDEVYEVSELAREFVKEYLSRDIEFLDVVEFVDETVDDGVLDGLYVEVHREVQAIMNDTYAEFMEQPHD